MRVAAVEKVGTAAQVLAYKDQAWRSIFWVSLPPGVLFVIGSLMVAESPRWLFRRHRRDDAIKALLKSRSDEQAAIEIEEMAQVEATELARSSSAASGTRESLFRRKYVIPFVLACVILACNQATGVNSIIGYNTTILLQSGLSDVQAHWGYLLLTLVNFLMTMVGVVLVDRRGRKFLLSIGSAGIIASLLFVAALFHRVEAQRVDVGEAMQAIVSDGTTPLTFDKNSAQQLAAKAGATLADGPSTLVVIYSYGDFRSATKVVRSDDPAATPLVLTRESCVPANKVLAFFSNPFADLSAARTAPLKIENALITPLPDESHGWLTALGTFAFIAFFAIGPGVCVWLALSELMPTRIRSNGMSIALFLNQAVSTGIAWCFLPTVGRHGYATMFFIFAGCTVVYFITAAFFLPETKGRTLEEIEAHFSGADRG
jgi:MFS family permease